MIERAMSMLIMDKLFLIYSVTDITFQSLSFRSQLGRGSY